MSGIKVIGLFASGFFLFLSKLPSERASSPGELGNALFLSIAVMLIVTIIAGEDK